MSKDINKKPPGVSLKVRPGRGFDCRCRVCGTQARATLGELGCAGFSASRKVKIYCPKCDNYVLV